MSVLLSPWVCRTQWHKAGEATSYCELAEFLIR
jgi:hypothetical protein